jgi:hypothetical protein
MLCIPMGATFEHLPAFPPFFLSALDGACSDFTFYILFGGFGSRGAIRKEKLQAMAPLKTFLPFGKEKGAIEKLKKDYIKLHIISPKFTRIPRSRYVVAVHIL